MPDQIFKIEIGQIWKHSGDPGAEYHVHSMRPSPYLDQLDVFTCLIFRNRIHRPDYFGRCLLDGTPRWAMGGWTIEPPPKFTPISSKFLKRKMRDRLVQQVLTGQDIGIQSADPSPNGDKT